MPISKVYEPVPGVHVALWHLVEDEATLYALFPPESRCLGDEALTGVAHATRRCERLAARLSLLRRGVADKVSYTPQGRPEISDETAHISISHPREWVAVALSSRSIGIDIERWSERPLRAATRFLSEDERAWVSATDAPADAATLLWSAKESIYKVMGAEGVDFSRHLRVEPFAYEHTSACRRFEAEESFLGTNGRFALYYGCFPDFVLTLALEGVAE